MNNRYKLPFGTQDYIGTECYNKRLVTAKIEQLFSCYGYDFIETPVLEYFKLFNEGFGAVDEHDLFSLTDEDGNLLSLRADMTIPLSRVVATKLTEEKPPIRLCYTANSFARGGSYLETREFTQSGVELIGSDSYLADVEVLSLAIESLLALDIADFRIDIGHVGFMSGIIKDLNIEGVQKDELVDAINKKDGLALVLCAQKLGLSENVVDILTKIPLLFGDIEILAEAKQLVKNDESVAAICNIEKIYIELEKKGYGQYLIFDLGYVQSMRYYSGIVFKGITRLCGSPLVSGGRYDELLHSFNKALPATGFAIGIKNILRVLDKSQKLQPLPKKDIAVAIEDGAESIAMDFISKNIKAGKIVVNTFLSDIELLKEYKKEGKAEKCVFITRKGVIEVE